MDGEGKYVQKVCGCSADYYSVKTGGGYTLYVRICNIHAGDAAFKNRVIGTVNELDARSLEKVG